jgi:stage II sporulation protein D
MKRFLYYSLMMIAVVIILPLLIVRTCDYSDPVKAPQESLEGMKVKVYVASEDKVREMDFEEYIKGVVAAEMPADFELEALKAQAVAARTFALGRIRKIYTSKEDTHKGADICTDFAHCQAWTTKDSVNKKWGVFSAYRNWNKISRAVAETRNTIIVYNNTVANPVFHSNSGGKTENAEDVWSGVSVPYLRSVVSEGEDASKEYKATVNVKTTDFCNTIKKSYPDFIISTKNILSDIKIIDYTEGGRVKNIKIGNITLKGTDLRKLFSLRSANFSIEKEGSDFLRITTLGYGHGVGMSQWGANYLAKKGAAFNEILEYYYSGVKIVSIDSLDKAEDS